MSTPLPASAQASQAGALSAVEQAFAALSQGDVAAALTFYDPAASVQGGACIPLPCVGTAAIQGQIQAGVSQQTRLRVVRGVEVGNVATGRYEARSSQLPSGVERIVGDFTALVTGGKITSLTLGLDASDGQTAEALRVLQGLPVAGKPSETVRQPERPSEPQSGTDDDIGKLGLAGLVGVVGLAALFRGRRHRTGSTESNQRVVARSIAYTEPTRDDLRLDRP